MLQSERETRKDQWIHGTLIVHRLTCPTISRANLAVLVKISIRPGDTEWTMCIVKLVSRATQPLVVGVRILGVVVRIVTEQKWTNNPLRLLIQIHCDTTNVRRTPIDGHTKNVEVLKVSPHLSEECRLIVAVDVGNQARFAHPTNGDVRLELTKPDRNMHPTRHSNGLPLRILTIHRNQGLKAS